MKTYYGSDDSVVVVVVVVVAIVFITSYISRGARVLTLGKGEREREMRFGGSGEW